MIVEQGTYKEKPVLTLKRDANDRWPFTFGVAKAKMLLDPAVLEAIRVFVAAHSQAA